VYGNGNPNTCSEGWSSSFYYVAVELSKSDISHINGQSVRSERNPHFRYNNLTLIRSQIMLHFLCANVVVVKCQAEGCEFCVLCFSFFFRGELRKAKFGQTKWNSNGCINALSALLPTLLVYTPYSILKKQTGLHSSCWWLDGWMVGWLDVAHPTKRAWQTTKRRRAWQNVKCQNLTCVWHISGSFYINQTPFFFGPTEKSNWNWNSNRTRSRNALSEISIKSFNNYAALNNLLIKTTNMFIDRFLLLIIWVILVLCWQYFENKSNSVTILHKIFFERE